MSNRRPQKALKWAWRLLSWLLILLGVLWLLQMFVLPGIVRRQVVSSLQSMGFAGSSLDVSQISLTGATISDLRAGDAIHARIVRVNYTPRDLFAGRVADIVVQGVTVRPDKFPGLTIVNRIGLPNRPHLPSV